MYKMYHCLYGLLLARLICQYCFARWHLSSVVVCNAAGGRVGRRARGRTADTARRASTVRAIIKYTVY